MKWLIGIIAVTCIIAGSVRVVHGQEEALCFNTCGDALVRDVAQSAAECCNTAGVGGTTLLLPGAECQPCSDLQALQFGIGFAADPSPINLGEDATLNCSVVLPPSVTSAMADITWFAPDGSVAETGTVTLPDLTLPLEITPFTAGDVGDYTCSATVSVPGFEPVTGANILSIAGEPTEVTVTESTPPEVGETYTLTCTVDRPGQDIQWLRGSDQSTITSDPASGIIVGPLMSDSTSSSRTLTFTSLSASDTDIYTCQNPVQNLPVPITVEFGELIPDVDTEINPNPPTIGEPLTLSCNSSTIPSVDGMLTATWCLPDGTNITAQGNDFVNLPLTIDPFDIDDVGEYTCKIRVESPLLDFPTETSTVVTTEIDQCVENNITCDPNARCVNREGDLQCLCIEGFSGDGFTCTSLMTVTMPTTPPSPSTNPPLSPVTVSTSPPTQPTATESPSTQPPTQPPTTQPINECASDELNNCDDNARCINLADGFRCRCLPGFRGNGVTCNDINECRTYRHRCDTRKDCSYYKFRSCKKRARCVNTPGSFECICNDGYQGNGRRCQDINECATGEDNCTNGARCFNTPGSFKCRCRAGDLGDGVNCCLSTNALDITNDSPATGTGTSTGTRSSTSRSTRRRTSTRRGKRRTNTRTKSTGTKSTTTRSSTSTRSVTNDTPVFDVPAGCERFVVAFLEEVSGSRTTGTTTRSRSTTRRSTRRSRG